MDALRQPQFILINHLAGPRVHRENNRQPGGNLIESGDDAGQGFPVVDVGRPVQGQEKILPQRFFQCRAGEAIRSPGIQQLRLAQKIVNHHVADQVDALLRLALPQQVVHPAGLGDEKIIADRVGYHAVDLFRHLQVPAPQPGLHVGDPDQHFLGHDAAGQGGVDIPDHHHQIRLLLPADLLEGDHDLCRLHRVAAGTGIKKKVRPGQLQVVEKRLGHLVVIVLPGVDDQTLKAVHLPGRVKNRGDLHKIRPGPGHQQYLHHPPPKIGDRPRFFSLQQNSHSSTRQKLPFS